MMPLVSVWTLSPPNKSLMVREGSNARRAWMFGPRRVRAKNHQQGMRGMHVVCSLPNTKPSLHGWYAARENSGEDVPRLPSIAKS